MWGGRDHIPLPGCALAMKQAQGYEAVVSAARVPKAAAFVAELEVEAEQWNRRAI